MEKQAPVALRSRARGMLLALAVIVGAVATTVCVGVARADVVPTADIAVVSQSADVRHAQVGDQVTFTVVATNNGPDAVDLNVVEDPALLYPGQFPPSGFQLVSEQCDRGISPDTPACEYGSVLPGETVTTLITTTLEPTTAKDAPNTVCVFSWNGPINDANQSNDCLTTTVRAVGKRGS
jgi:uncharacterized repeat protein (TIGR01451 family)